MNIKSYTNSALLTLLLGGVGGGLLASCADFQEDNFSVEKPANIAAYEYLQAYAPLKEYVHGTSRAVGPNFKVAGALTASVYNEGGVVNRLANSNFDEIVAGNAMKMASCVDDKGKTNFETVTSFVNKAEEAGISVYGHTLAWHSQQPVKYLTNLIKDKELDIDPNQKNEIEVATVTYNDGGFPFYPMGCEPPIVNGAIHFVPTGDWSQFFITNAITLTPGDYVLKMQIASSKAGSITLTTQNGWSNAQQINGTVKLEEGWTEAAIKFNGIEGGNYDFILKPETFDATLDIKGFTVYRLESPAVEVEHEIKAFNYLDSYGANAAFPFYPMGSEPPIVNGALHFEPTGAWSQFFIDNATALEPGNYKIVLDIKGSENTSITLTAQNGWSNAQQINGSVKVTTEWGKATINLPELEGGNYDFILKPETNPATIDLKGYTIYKIEKMNSIPLTDEEKKEVLSGAMKTWIADMMNATQGKVKAWDLVNEAISGGNADSEGVYALQHGTDPNSGSWDVGGTAFFWQDFLGDIDYVRTAEAAAREAYAAIEGTNPSDLKLFINDYNLESDWDNNGKVKSLVKWIQRWEADGKTKIDGIGTQMHISYYENPQTLESKKNHIINMYKEMVKSGKLIRVSEFDMGYVDANGKSLSTSQLTEEQHKAMADYWNWNIRAYLDNVPADQQWSFCSWCITDAPATSGWRGGEPVGLWDENYNRKHTYAGYADGLQGKDYQK